ncbi:MAG: hypothetical protein M3018_00715 [Actinomycetota bacterium]|nr:hypothetical protein [Actinomycetota bacterium]
MLDHGCLRLARILLRVDADVQYWTRVGCDCVHGTVHRGRIDADDCDRRSGPDPRRQATRTEQRYTIQNRSELAELLLALRRPIPFDAPQAGDGDIAVLVVE